MIAVNVSDSAGIGTLERDRRMIVVTSSGVDETGHAEDADQGEDEPRLRDAIAIPTPRTDRVDDGLDDRRCSLSDRATMNIRRGRQDEKGAETHSSARRRPDTESASGFTLQSSPASSNAPRGSAAWGRRSPDITPSFAERYGERGESHRQRECAESATKL